ncbi:hypothetical protein F917_02526 [Acinetobacter baumannii NIPH 67]|uniref:hypothetical protein n=1 Tax=Acinetobacter baumannii TaxID=470 RepID=UPI0002CFE08E|nr:hypothetical protein [Acinetobacter baumannii]ENW48654.1 hypothetical protein F917_02526 [Acinetobacter baumannii NIPH 67]
MKLSNIEYTQRTQELEILLNFYLMQIKPISMKAIGLRDVYYSVMAYLKIVLQLEKLILSFVYNGKLERNEEQDLFNLLDEIYKQGVGHFELEKVSALDKELAEPEIPATNVVLLSELHGIAKVILDSDYTKALFQLYWVWHKKFSEVSHKEMFIDFLKKRKNFILQNSASVLEKFTSNFWVSRDQRIVKLQSTFDQMFASRNSVKVLCVNLFAPKFDDEAQVAAFDDEAQIVFLNEALKKLRSEMRKKEHYLGLFYKLEYGADGQFFYFCVVVFENLKTLSIRDLDENVTTVWKAIYTDSYPLDPQAKPRLAECLNSKLYRTATLQAGVITRRGTSYAQFVRTTLAYIANAPHLLRILFRKVVCAEEKPYDCVEKPGDIPKKAITPRKPKKLEHHQENQSLLQILKLKNVFKPLQKDIHDIGLCYEHLPYIDQPYRQNILDFKLTMIRMEVAVLLAPVWKGDPVTNEGGKIKQNDWGGLIQDELQEQKNIKVLLQYADFMGPRVLCFIAAFFMLSKQYSHVYGDSLYKTALHQKIRELIALPLKMFKEQIKGLVEERLMPAAAFTKLETLLTSQRLETETLQDWLKVQERVKKRSFLAVDSYIKKLENQQSLYRDVEFSIIALKPQSLKPIDTLLKNIIDHFNKTHQELMGYVGYWSLQQVDEQKVKYIATLTFYLDKRYIESTEPENWFEKLKHEAELRLGKKTEALKIDKIKVKKIANIMEYIESFQSRFNKMHPLRRYTSSLLFALIHRDLYWMHTAVLQKQILIRGRTGYKKRTRKKIKKQV